MVAHTGDAAEDGADQRHDGHGDRGDDAASAQGAFVDRDPREAADRGQDVVLGPRDGADDCDHHRRHERPEPDSESLLRSAETGHPASDVTTGEVGDEEQNDQGDCPDQAYGGGVVGRLSSGLVEGRVVGDPDRNPDRHQKCGQQRRRSGSREPTEERRPDLDATELLLLQLENGRPVCDWAHDGRVTPTINRPGVLEYHRVSCCRSRALGRTGWSDSAALCQREGGCRSCLRRTGWAGTDGSARSSLLVPSSR